MPPALRSPSPLCTLAGLALGTAFSSGSPAAVGQIAPRFVAGREVLLSVAAEDEACERIEMWQRRFPNRNWEKATCERKEGNTVLFNTELDGRLGLYFVLENAAGASGTPPTEDTPPQFSIVVDTAAPTLQIRRAHAVEGSSPREIELRMTLIEENLGPAGLAIFYRGDANQPWKDGGPLKFSPAGEKLANLRVQWPVPDDLTGSADLMVVATDLAGNSAREETRGVRVGDARGHADRRAADVAPAPAAEDPIGRKSALVPPLDPPLVSEIDRQKVERLRNLASRYALDDKYDLAGARFEEAIRTTPEDATLFSEFGTMLVRASRYDDARTRFEEALRLSPRDITAREGLALAAAGQQRYSDARDALRKLLADEPQTSRLWLRLGDLEYRLGNKPEAYDAWEKVLNAGNADIALARTARERLKQLKR